MSCSKYSAVYVILGQSPGEITGIVIGTVIVLLAII